MVIINCLDKIKTVGGNVFVCLFVFLSEIPLGRVCSEGQVGGAG